SGGGARQSGQPAGIGSGRPPRPRPFQRRRAAGGDRAVRQVAAPESARLLLTDRLANDRSPAVQSEALRRLMALPGGIGIPAVTEAARAHPNPELRADARERLRERR